MSGTAVTQPGDGATPLASDLARRVREGSLLIANVVLCAERDGLVARVRLDPLLIHARAGQQGLADRSVAAAAADPRVQRVIEDAIAQANAACPPGERIVRHEIVPTEGARISRNGDC